MEYIRRMLTYKEPMMRNKTLRREEFIRDDYDNNSIDVALSQRNQGKYAVKTNYWEDYSLFNQIDALRKTLKFINKF